MNYQMIAMDLDGTLLNGKSMLSLRSQEMISRLKALGKIIVIASGRTDGEIRRLTAPLELTDYPNAYFICYNGVLTLEAKSGKKLTKMLLSKEDVLTIIKETRSFNLDLHVFTEGSLYLSPNIRLSLANQLSEKTKIKTLNVDKLDIDEDIYKVLFYDDFSKLNDFKSKMPQILLNRYGIVKSHSQLLEIFHKEGSKGHALEILAKMLDVPQESIIAFGDEENDLTMIKYAGLGVAMGNAKPDVLVAAKAITLTNEFEGVAVAVDKYVFSGRGLSK